MDRQRVGDMMERVHAVPDGYRRFVTPPREARRRYGIDTDLLDELVAAGLPCRGHGEQARFDALDLENIGIGLELPSAQTTMLRHWSRSLTRDRQAQRGGYEVTLTWRCPEPGHAGSCDFALSPLLTPVTRDGERWAPTQGSVVLRAEPLNDRYEFGADFAALVEAATVLTFHRLPSALSRDLTFLHATGLADCRLASCHLIGKAAALGMNTRPGAGLFIGAPFPTVHSWIEIEVDGRWVAADPFFLDTLGRWGVIDREDWPLACSPRNVLWRLTSALSLGAPLATHRGDEAPASVSARWVPA